MTDTLLSLAQLAVAITGFASIVLVFQRRESGRWARSGANSFNGMLFHSMAALVSCLLPVRSRRSEPRRACSGEP